MLLNNKKIKSKLTDRGNIGWFVGYSTNHPTDTLRFIKKNNHQIVLSPNYCWIDKLQQLKIKTIEEIDQIQEIKLINKPDEVKSTSEHLGKNNVENNTSVHTSNVDPDIKKQKLKIIKYPSI